jgi:polysaccharide biosynthesis/export protein
MGASRTTPSGTVVSENRRLRVASAVISAAILLAGCAFMPASGPAGPNVRAGERDPQGLQYAFVKISPSVINVLATNVPELGKAFRDTRPPGAITFGVGDVVSVTIFEAAAGGLFIPSEAGVRPGNFVTLPNQAVDSNGNISVPYAGQVRAAGRTPPQVQVEIVNALKNRAIEPQAVVSTVDQRTSLVSVLGDVNNPSRFPANAAGEHLLDTITRAGGPKSQGYDTWVMLERGGRREIVPFGALVYEPKLNDIWTHPNDTLYLYRESQTFVAFGASGQQGQFVFGDWRLSLAESIAKAGGLNDTSAEPANVFLYRGETRQVATQLGIDCSPFRGPIIPVVYNINLRDPSGYFLATKFQMRDKDVIYISDATVVNATKAMTFFSQVISTINDPIATATNVYNLKNTIAGAAAVSPGVIP